jgi:hypothetical protein
MVKKLNGVFRAWMKIAQLGESAPPIIWGRCIVHLGNPMFSGRILHTAGLIEITHHKSITIVETRNNYYALLGPELEMPAGRPIDPVAFLEAQPNIVQPTDIFATAAMNAERDCAKCDGRGVYRRAESSLVICDLCCKHNQGWWLLEGGYGVNNGRWACKLGCGMVVDRPAPELEFLPRAAKVFSANASTALAPSPPTELAPC